MNVLDYQKGNEATRSTKSITDLTFSVLIISMLLHVGTSRLSIAVKDLSLCCLALVDSPHLVFSAWWIECEGARLPEHGNETTRPVGTVVPPASQHESGC